MQTIDAIELKNFGIHKEKIRIELCPTSNVIIGDNDVGKSTFLKGLRLLAYNKPASSHKKFANNKEQDYFIAVETTRDNVQYRIERTKNRYRIFKSGKLIHNLTKFNQNVPEPVAQILPLKDINWERQNPKEHYLLFETGGIANAKLVKAFGLEDQKKLSDDCRTQLLLCRNDFKVQVALKKTAKEEIEKLEPIYDFEERIKGIVVKQKEIDKLDKYIYNLSWLVQQLETIKYVHPLKMETIRLKLGELNMLNEEDRELVRKHKELWTIMNALDDLKITNDNAIRIIRRRLQKLSICIEELDAIIENQIKLENIIKMCEKYGDDSILYKMGEIQKDYNELLKRYGVCPTCSQIISENHTCKL